MSAVGIVALWVVVSVPTALVVAAVFRATRGSELSEEVEFYLKGLGARHGTGLLRRVRIATVSAIGIAVIVALASGLGRMPSRVYAVADHTRALFGAGPGPHAPPVVDLERVDDVAVEVGDDDPPAPDGQARRGDSPVSLADPGSTTSVSRAPDLSFADQEDAHDAAEPSADDGEVDHRPPGGIEIQRAGDDATEEAADADDDGDDRNRDRERDRHRDRDDEPVTTTTAPPAPASGETPTTTTTAPPAADEPPAGDVEPPPPDTDGDSIEDGADRDLDGDAVENADDEDVDGDGQANTEDADIDEDGVVNADDPTPYGYVPEDDGHDDNDPPVSGEASG
jgi:hypothetical protein